MIHDWRFSFRRAALTVAITTALGVGTIGVGQAFGGISEREITPGKSLSAETPLVETQSFSSLASRVKPAVVNVSVEGRAQVPHAVPAIPFPEFFERHFGRPPSISPQQRKTRAVGSGFIVDPTGYIITNDHVIRQAERIFVTLDDGTTLLAKVAGRDPYTDLAVLKVDGESFPFVTLGDSDEIRIGDWVVAVGNPFGFGGSFTAGILSARGRDIRSGPYDDYLQIDAPINRGNSGGPLFDAAGKVIGVNTAIFSPTGGNVGIGFAIPAKVVATVVKDLIAKGVVDRGWLGVRIQPLMESSSDPNRVSNRQKSDAWDNRGVLIAHVAKGSPAARAGIKVGDRILNISGQKVGTFRALSRAIGMRRAGEEMPLLLLRRGEEITLNAVLTRAPSTLAASKGQLTEAPQTQLGVRVFPLTPEVRARWVIEDKVQGLLVVEVRPHSPAAQGGLQAGDVIIGVDSQPIKSIDALREVIARSAIESAGVALAIVRHGSKHSLMIDIT